AFDASNAPPRRVGATPFASGEVPGTSAATIDALAGYAVFGGARLPDSHVVKFALGIGENLPARAGGIALLPNEGSVHCGTGDPSSGLAWFGTSTQPG